MPFGLRRRACCTKNRVLQTLSKKRPGPLYGPPGNWIAWGRVSYPDHDITVNVSGQGRG